MMKIGLHLLTILSLSCVSCKKDTNAPEFNVIDKVLEDSVPVKFGGVCYTIISVKGKTVYTKGMGGYTGNTRQLIASCSKWLSAGVIMRLADEGKFKLTDSVGKYLPVFTTYGKGGITIAQLFSHTSGFPGNSTQGYESDPFSTLTDAVDLIAKNVPLANPPGTKFYYGGVSMQVAGRICEVVAGKNWKTLLAEKILTPCGMTDTDFGLTQNPIIGGGARSTPNDYIKYLNMLANNGIAANGTRVLSEAAIAAMQQSYTGNTTIAYTPYITLQTPDFYGIGNWRDLTGTGGVLIENSSPGAFGSHPWINQEKKICGFVFTYIPVSNASQLTLPTCLEIRRLARTIVPQQ